MEFNEPANQRHGARLLFVIQESHRHRRVAQPVKKPVICLRLKRGLGRAFNDIFAYASENLLDRRSIDLRDGEARPYSPARGFGTGVNPGHDWLALDAAHSHPDRGARRTVAIETFLRHIDSRMSVAQFAYHLPKNPIKLRAISRRFGLRAENLSLQSPIDAAVTLVVIVLVYRPPDLLEDFQPVFTSVGDPGALRANDGLRANRRRLQANQRAEK